MFTPHAKVVADSIDPVTDVRVTTFEVTKWRWTLAEFNTHRVFSRNSASSRAIPVWKQLARLDKGIAEPVEWPREQKGMQGGEPLDPNQQEQAREEWAKSYLAVREHVDELLRLSVHKSVVNRLLEPYMSHTVVVTATAWGNFFEQRCNRQAQPEIRLVAEMMREAYNDSEPRLISEGEGWHLPYVWDDEETKQEIFDRHGPTQGLRELAKISAARCARTSYLTHDGRRDVDEDLGLYQRLTEATPIHWSPLEHPATPWWSNQQNVGPSFTWDGRVVTIPVLHLPRVGNLLGWRSLRTEVEALTRTVTYR